MDEQKKWQKILSAIKEQTSPVNFKGWFSQTTIGSISEDTVTITVPSAFIKNQLSSRFGKIIEQSIEITLGKGFTVSYLIDSLKFTKTKGEEDEPFQFENYPPPQLSQTNSSSPLNPKYTLQNFVVGLTNNLAYAAAQAVVQNPGISYNPLFIYGPSGVGKTHLMQGIGNTLITKNPYLKLMTIPSEKFMNDFIESIQTKKMGQFRQKYRSCNILLIDDIQFISGKDSTQEEFFHTFNELHTRNSQVVLTSDRPPGEIQMLEPRLASRFQGGLMVDIQLPDFDTRVAILKAKLAEKGETMPEDIIKKIAENIESNTRELEGKLIQILQVIKLSNQPADSETIKRLLSKNSQPQLSIPDYRKVLSCVNQYFNTKLSDILGPRRQKGLVFPRQIAMFLMYEDCKIPLEKVGEILGGRDHTTVMHGVEKIKLAIDRDREIQKVIVEIRHLAS